MLRWMVGVAVVVVAAVGFAVPAYAAERSFVSGDGTDAGTCERQAPCRTFAFAITQAPAGGEIVAVDSAGYGPVTITKSISLIGARGIHAGITAPNGGNAITVNAGTSDQVVLRNLYLDGAKGASRGIDYTGAGAVVVEDCVIANFTEFGIARLVTSAGAAQLTVSDSVLRGNAVGLRLQDVGPGSIAAQIDHTRAALGDDGFIIGTDTRATITDSIATRNGVSGFSVFNGRLFMERDTTSGNGTGIFVGGGTARAVVSNSTIVDNTTGLDAMFGELLSRGNNTLFGNGTDGIFTGNIPAAYRAP
jgi:hypothetical protein